MATLVKNKAQAAAKTPVRKSSNWIEVGEGPESSIKILSEFSVKDMQEAGYKLAAQVKVNVNGTKYLLCIDEEEGKKAALYMFKALSTNVIENQILKANEIAIFEVESTDDKGQVTENFVIGTPGFTGGIVFFG